MSGLRITTSYQAICNCGRDYGDASDSEMEAVEFTREFPTCQECETKDKP